MIRFKTIDSRNLVIDVLNMVVSATSLKVFRGNAEKPNGK